MYDIYIYIYIHISCRGDEAATRRAPVRQLAGDLQGGPVGFQEFHLGLLLIICSCNSIVRIMITSTTTDCLQGGAVGLQEFANYLIIVIVIVTVTVIVIVVAIVIVIVIVIVMVAVIHCDKDTFRSLGFRV